MNTMVRRYLRKWDWELDQIANNCWSIQLKQFEEIVKSPYVHFLNQDIGEIKDYESFRSKISINTYDNLEDRIVQLKNSDSLSCRYFAQSAGTSSGKKKLIPTPEVFVKRSHLRGSWYILHTLYKFNPSMSVFKAKNLLIGGSLYEINKNQIIGDVSGIMLNRIPQFFRPWYVPTIKIATHPDWEYKIQKTAIAASKTRSVTLLGGIPTWMLSVCRSVLERTGKQNLSDLWPHLQAYIHGGVSFLPYQEQFETLIAKDEFRYLEVYNASEGFFAYQDHPTKEGMLLMCASGIFYEFIETEKYKQGARDILNIAEVELGKSYVILISSINGFLRYELGDVITFVSIAPYRIKVTGRITEYLNAFGEDLLLSQVEEALLKVQEQIKFSIRDYTIAPSFLRIENNGCHEWYIEFF